MVMLKKVIQCLGAWLTNKQCPTDSLAESPLMHLVLHLLVCFYMEILHFDIYIMEFKTFMS
jgi:hypothetical protein